MGSPSTASGILKREEVFGEVRRDSHGCTPGGKAEVTRVSRLVKGRSRLPPKALFALLRGFGFE